MWFWLILLIAGLWLYERANQPDEARGAQALAEVNDLRGAQQAALIYGSYNPASPALSASRIPSWRAEFLADPPRREAKARSIPTGDLRWFSTADGADLRISCVSRLRRIAGSASAFPAEKPWIKQQVQPPPAPSLISEKEFLARDTGSRLSRRQKSQVKAIIFEQNQLIRSAYDQAFKRYRAAEERGLRQLDDLVDGWERGRAAWQAARENEASRIRSLVAALEKADEPQAAALAILQYLRLPPWAPQRFELEFDAKTGRLVVEHELPDIEGVEWIERPGTSDLGRAEAAARIYPDMTFYLAKSVLKQMPGGSVEAIVVNGWRQTARAPAAPADRAFCSTLQLSHARLREVEREDLDASAAFEALGGEASRPPDFAALSPMVRIAPNDRRYVRPVALEEVEAVGG